MNYEEMEDVLENVMVKNVDPEGVFLRYKTSGKENELQEIINTLSENLTSADFAKRIGYSGRNRSRSSAINNIRNGSRISLDKLINVYNLAEKLGESLPHSIIELVYAADKITIANNPRSRINVFDVVGYLYAKLV